MTQPGRINPLAAPSPTGMPFVPVSLVPYLTALVGLAWALDLVLPPHTIAARIANAVVGAGAMVGLASPGLRRR